MLLGALINHQYIMMNLESHVHVQGCVQFQERYEKTLISLTLMFFARGSTPKNTYRVPWQRQVDILVQGT